MNTTPTYTVIAKDGKMKLTQWKQTFNTPPTVGDPLEVPTSLAGALPGYKPQASVSLIRIDPQSGDQVIEAEIECRLSREQRPGVILNSNFIPPRARTQVENYLKEHLQAPVIDWEESTLGRPIVGLHLFPNQPKLEEIPLQDALRRIVRNAGDLACA